MYELTCQFISLANLIKIFTYTCMNQLNQHVSLSLSQMYLSLELPTTTYLKFVSVLRLSVLFCPLLRPPSLSLSSSSILSLCPATYKKKKILSSIEDYYIRIGTMLERILLITVITLAYLYCPNRTE
uniref:Uncharacterized protein n=1 Tax=Cacopsylla melanoneura TaxID=428564 RepID=A0A8D9BDP7_9HEMI